MPTDAAGGLSHTELLRLDYQQTTDMLRSLTDVRFKLLALVPTLSGAAVAVLGHPGSAAELLAIGLLGLIATLGILLYELRNTQLSEYGMRRARQIEAQLGLGALGSGAGNAAGPGAAGPGAAGPGAAGGLFSERPTQTLRLVGLAPIDRDRGLALVYGAALAGWTYLVAWGALRGFDVGAARKIGAGIGAGAGLLVIAEVIRVHRPPTS